MTAWAATVYDPLMHLEILQNEDNIVACGVRLTANNSARDPFLFARNLSSRRYRVCADCEVQFTEHLQALRELGEDRLAELLLMTTYEGATRDRYRAVHATDAGAGEGGSPLAG